MSSEVSLFVRKASGLVRAWSIFDAFIYATFSINLITLGLFIFSYCWYFGGSLGTAIVVGGIFTIFEVIVYASLISAMPRAGGDYVWQSRILGTRPRVPAQHHWLVVHPLALGSALWPNPDLRISDPHGCPAWRARNRSLVHRHERRSAWWACWLSV